VFSLALLPMIYRTPSVVDRFANGFSLGEHVQGHFGRNFRQSFHQKVRRTHPHLERAEGMFGRLAAHAHRLRVLIETLLHGFEHVPVLPSRDAPLGPLRTLRFERAARACGRPIAAQRLAILLVRITVGQLFARAAVDILRRQIFAACF
jgi:hypothetical protein